MIVMITEPVPNDHKEGVVTPGCFNALHAEFIDMIFNTTLHHFWSFYHEKQIQKYKKYNKNSLPVAISL